MVDSYNVIFIRDWLEFSIAMVSLFCSSFTLYIIYLLKVWNGNLLLISTLTCFQILYDINFLFGPSNYYSTCVVWNFLDILGGLGTSFTTNVISLTMMYIVIRIKSINILQNYKYFFIFMGMIPLVFAVLTLVVIVPADRDDDKPYTDCVYNGSFLAVVIHNVYYWGRLASIIFNFAAFWYLSYKIKRLGFIQSIFQFGLSFSAALSPSSISAEHFNPATTVTGAAAGVVGNGGIMIGSTNNPLLTIADQQKLAVQIIVARMRFYPLAQALCRSGAAWDEYDDYKYSNNTSSLMASICSPLSGVFYLMIFLMMQPNAWKLCKSVLADFYRKIFRSDPPCNRIKSGREGNDEENIRAPSIHLGQRKSLTNIFRTSVALMDDNMLESIINYRDSNSLSDLNTHLSTLLASMNQKKEGGGSSESNQTINSLHHATASIEMKTGTEKYDDDDEEKEEEL